MSSNQPSKPPPNSFHARTNMAAPMIPATPAATAGRTIFPPLLTGGETGGAEDATGTTAAGGTPDPAGAVASHGQDVMVVVLRTSVFTFPLEV
jgi:hypothetical protein